MACPRPAGVWTAFIGRFVYSRGDGLSSPCGGVDLRSMDEPRLSRRSHSRGDGLSSPCAGDETSFI